MSGATDVDSGIFGARPEDQQAEQADGEATLQGAAVGDALWVQQLVAMVITQRSGLPEVVQMFPEEPNHRMDLKDSGESTTRTDAKTDS